MMPWNTTALTIKTNSTSCEEQYVKNRRNFVMFKFLHKYAKIMVVLMRSSPNAKSAELSSMYLAYFFEFIFAAILGKIVSIYFLLSEYEI